MKILKYTEASFQKEFEAVLATSSLFDLEIEERVRTIIQKVQIEGDDGLLSLVENIDGIKLTPQQLRVAMEEEIAASLKTISNKEMDQAFKKALFDKIEDEYDLMVAESAYSEYIANGKESRPIQELWEELEL